MREAKLDKLRVLFDRLAGHPQDAPLDQMAIEALGLLSVLSEDQKTTGLIAADLALVFESNAYERVDTFLKEEFKQIDSEFEPNLRGFSALLDHVLLENTVRLDTGDLLKRLPRSYQLLAKPFYEFIRRIESYYDLSMAFGLSCKKVLTILFIDLLVKLYCVKFSLNKSDSLCLVNHWLLSWLGCKSKILIIDFSIADQLAIISYVEDKNIYAHEYVLAYLSIASADGVLLEETHMARLDAVLQETGFLGLRPLLDAGFLGLAKAKLDNPAKIFRP